MGLQRYKLFLFYQIFFEKRDKKGKRKIGNTASKPFTAMHYTGNKFSISRDK